MTDGQYSVITIISAIVLLVILRFIKRRLPRTETPIELYEDIAQPSATSAVNVK